jgi:hypothetical protein
MNRSHCTPLNARRRTLLAAVVAAVVAALGFSSSALAGVHHPTGAYAPFADCPLGNASVEECLVATTSSGEFVVGKKTVPISNAITLQGGTHENEETGALNFIGAENGLTLSKTPQSVPGGLAGLVNCKEIGNIIERVACEATFENGLTGVNATTELAAPATSIGINVGDLLEGKGVALSLPVKVHLENPLFGSECYVGSSSKPIVLELTTGTTSPPAPNTPIKGNPGKLSIKEGGALLEISSNSLVNNSFAAPEATGCGGIFSFLIDPIVDSTLGVPSAAGHNTAILNGTLKQAAAVAVKASES